MSSSSQTSVEKTVGRDESELEILKHHREEDDGSAILYIRVRKVRDGYANKVRANEENIKKADF